MAIIIPSKSIYGVENPKIRDNIINRIDLDCVEPTSHYITEDNGVYSQIKTLQDGTVNASYETGIKLTHYDAVYTDGRIERYLEGVSVGTRYADLSDTIERYKDSYYLQKIYIGTKTEQSQKTNNISTTITYRVRKTNVKGTITNAYGGTNSYGSAMGWNEDLIKRIIQQTINPNTYNDVYEIPTTGETPKETSESADKLNTGVKYITNKGSSYDLVVYDMSTIDSENIIKKDPLESFELGYKFLIKTKKLRIVAGFEDDDPYSTKYRDAFVEGEIEETIPETLQISVNGITIGIDLKDKGIRYDLDNNKYKIPYKIERNELLQTTNFYYGNETTKITVEGVLLEDGDTKTYEISSQYKFNIGDKISYNNEIAIVEGFNSFYNLYIIRAVSNGNFESSIGKQIEVLFVDKIIKYSELDRQYTSLLEQYKNGKETAVINCSISEYKDQDGNVVINPKTSDKMIFEMYDIVIPYKQGFVNGVQQDVPLSKYPNGEPKQFQVLGVKPHTRGVLRQELTLQEISQSTLQNK